METSREVGQAIWERFPQVRARMDHPDLLVKIDIRDQAYLSSDTIPGPGGLPFGTGGRALALISGGIDSPVARCLVGRRGVTVLLVNLYIFPFSSEELKVKDLDLRCDFARRQ